MDRPRRIVWLAASLLLVAGAMVLTMVVGSALKVGAASDFVLVDPTSFTVSEPNGQGTFTITLSIQPTARVTVGLTITSTECAVAPGSLLLTADNWATGAAATVTAQDDAIADGPQICGIETSAAVSADPTFNGEDPDDVVVTVIDDDGPMDASIGDFVWFDQNGDGIQDGTEAGLSGVTVYLDLDNDATLDPGEPFDTTDTAGTYDITGLAAGTYPVRVDDATLPVGCSLTTGNIPHNVILTESEDYNDSDFGYQGYILDVTVLGTGGSVSVDPDQLTYLYGTSVVLTPTASLGWTFDGWSGPDVGDLSDNGDGSWSLTMDASKALTATFTEVQFILTVNVDGNGLVDKSPDQPTYPYDTSVVLTPTATLGWSFADWGGPDQDSLSDNGDGSWSLTMDEDKKVTATFTEDQYYVAMTIDGMGAVENSPGNPYTYGLTATLTPLPSPDWRFDSWTGSDAGDLSDNGDGSWSITMDASKALTATFTEDDYSLAVTVVGDGSVLRAPDQLTYAHGTPVVLTPTATLGWTFAGWSGPDVADLSDNGDGSWSITMDASKALTATFTQDYYTLDVTVIGDGSVLRAPDQITYAHGTPVVLTPTAILGWSFAGWSGPDAADLSDNGDGSWSITMDASKVLTATFTEDDYSLDITDDGDGSVLREPDQLTYSHGTPVVLTPTASLNWTFAGWSGPDVADLSDNGDGSWFITMDASKALTATFTLTEDQYALDLSVIGNGSVIVEPDRTTYEYGEEVTLTAVADPGWVFTGWSGDLSGDTNPATLTVLRDTLVVAVFTFDDYTLTVNSVGNGSVSKEPNQVIYHYGDEVTLTATPDSGWGFAGWSEDLSGITNPAILFMDGHKTVTALFEWQHDLTVDTLGPGSIVLDPPGGVYSHDTVVQITAVPDPGWTFTGWSGDLTGTDNPAFLTLDRDKTVSASFAYLVYLPAILNRWPPTPSVPSLSPIDNADGNGDYAVTWSVSSNADTYVLQEATKSDFADAITVYSGPSTTHAVSGQGAARYYYRVQARNLWVESDWSNVRQVDVLWEAEPNDEAHAQANGPIIPGLIYYGTFPDEDDADDYYFFDLTAAYRVEMWLTEIPGGQNFDLVLRNASLAVVGYSAQPSNSSEHIRTDGDLPPGRYYIQVFHFSSGGSMQPYQLKYTLE